MGLLPNKVVSLYNKGRAIKGACAPLPLMADPESIPRDHAAFEVPAHRFDDFRTRQE